jgi:hypothetical protein
VDLGINNTPADPDSLKKRPNKVANLPVNLPPITKIFHGVHPTLRELVLSKGYKKTRALHEFYGPGLKGNL